MVASATAMKFSGVGLLATRMPKPGGRLQIDLVRPDEGHDDEPEPGAASRTPRLIVSRCEARMTSTSRAASTRSASVYAARLG